MALPSVFEVYQLAIGPSTVFTTGALRIGQSFRELLMTSPYRPNHRILIQLLGNFSKFGRENNSDRAVIAGLGGYTLEDSTSTMMACYGKIKENGYFSFKNDSWPFNPESDLVFNTREDNINHPNCIRFHVLSYQGQLVFQADFYSTGSGLVTGPGYPDTEPLRKENHPKSLNDIKSIIRSEGISFLDYTISNECARHHISREQFQKRMVATWKLMIANTYHHPDFLLLLKASPLAGGDNTRASAFALGLSEDILSNSPVITAPTCTGAAILPSVLRPLQERFMFPDEKIVDGMILGGLLGTLILYRLGESNRLVNMQNELAFSAIMAAGGITHIMGGSPEEIEKAASMAAILYGLPDPNDSFFEPKSFKLRNSIIAQTVPALADLAKTLPDGLIPDFDASLSKLFHR
ncbi:MAG: serine dehydratase beta chain [Bacteroidales bacterium]